MIIRDNRIREDILSLLNDIAKSFGGGGHKLAAGASVNNLSGSEIEDKILRILKGKINVN